MKIAVMGSGGVGGFYGGRLAHAGYDVTFVARGAHLAAMREHGLTIESEAQGNIHVPRVNATDDPATIGTVDIVLIAREAVGHRGRGARGEAARRPAAPACCRCRTA